MARVVIFGGGVGGLSAAHELVERGFEVVVFERRNLWGGKARSYGVAGSGAGGRKDLPGEHGFRLFPSFYKHLPDTMKRIPFGTNPDGVFDNLLTACQMEIAREGMPSVVAETCYPSTLEEWFTALRSFFLADNLGVPPHEARYFAGRLLTILTSCQERRLAEYEKSPWWKFVEADGKSEVYQTLLAKGLTRKLIAMRAEEASTRTVGNIGIQLLLDVVTPGQTSDRLLNRPTSEAWIDPWVDYLRRQDVVLHLNASLRRLNYDGQRIRSATVQIDGTEQDVQADYYVCAVPVEVMQRLLTPELKEGAPSLAHLDRLQTEWMIGMQFYLRKDVPIVRGHVIYADSAWALTSISQHQFWRQVDLSEYGNGEVRGILSVDIADWHTPGNKVVFKPANQCTNEELKAEVWAQLKAHLNLGNQQQLADADLLTWNLDPDVRLPRTLPQDDESVEPLLVNTAGSWQYRPEADLSNGLYREIPNLFIAADYVRTYTDLATMEGANEAARRAVNGILKESGSRAEPCRLWPLEEPAVFAPFRSYDLARFKLGFGHSLPSTAAWEPVRTYLSADKWPQMVEKAREALKPNEYRFRVSWTFQSSPQEIWALVADPDTYPEWWGQYPEVRRLNQIHGTGALWEMRLQFVPDLPYRFQFTLELMVTQEPQVVDWRARGDLNGHVGFTLEETDFGTRVTYTGTLQTAKRALNMVAPLTRPFFVRHHDTMMRRAANDLRAALVRRAAGPRRPDPNLGLIRYVLPGAGPSLVGAHGQVTFKAVSADTGGAFSLVEMQDPPQGGNPLHIVHQYDLGCCVLEGEYAIQIGERVRMASPGSFAFVPRGTSVGWTNLGTAPGKILLIISPAGLERAIEETFYARDASTRAAIYQRYGVEMNLPMAAVQRPPTRGGGIGPQRADAPDRQTREKMFRLGTTIFILEAAGEDTRGAYTLFGTQNPPQDGPPLHVHHREDEGFYILEGEYVFRIGDRTFSALPGAFLLAPKGIPHRYVQVSPTGGRYLVVASPPGFENFVAAAGEPISDSSAAPAVPEAQVLERIREAGRRFGIDTVEESGAAGAFPSGM